MSVCWADTYTALQAAVVTSIHCCLNGSSIISRAITLRSIILDVAKDGIPATAERRNTLMIYIPEPVGIDTNGKTGYSR
jgi:hypothetical protein